MQRNKNGRFTTVKKEEKTMFTLSQAVGYLKTHDPKMNKAKLSVILSSPKNSAIFTADTVKRTHFHDEVPDLVEIDQAALDAYLTAKASGAIAKRATRAGKPRKHTVYIPDAAAADVYASLNTFADRGVTYEAAYKARKAKTAPVTSTPQDTNAPADLVEDLIEA